MTEFSLTGSTQTRAFDFLRIRAAIGLEMKGLKMGQGSALKAAEIKGYVPRVLVARGAIDKRREAAHAYMSYVATLLTGGGGLARTFAEEVITGKLVFAETDTCGCPTFEPAKDQTNRVGLLPLEKATMCIHEGQA